MDDYKGKTISWVLSDGVVELALDRPPANEIGLAMLEDLERFVSSLPTLESKASALILYSEQKAGFSAGADLRELYERAQKMDASSAAKGVRDPREVEPGSGWFASRKPYRWRLSEPR